MFLNIFFEEIKWILLRKKLKKIKLLILDVDGVITDGYLFYDFQGNQMKRFSVKDGLGIRYLQKAGLNICIVTGGKEDVIKKRSEDLNIKNIYCSVENKKEKVEILQNEFKVNKENILFVGDDLNDLTVRKSVGILIAPNDASKKLKRYSDAKSIEKDGFSELNS